MVWVAFTSSASVAETLNCSSDPSFTVLLGMAARTGATFAVVELATAV